ncbi:MAG TPA: amino acid ABC transporter substrate-binding protein [Alphaproteobacteria bacterium]|jgi:branched-chain amino acid transport system substrate-binding protein
MKRIFGTLIAAAAAVAVSAGATAAEPVRIGYSMAKTGLFAQGAVSQINAYELWREQVNAQGGLDIGGKEKRPVEFVVYDDQSDPANAVRIYEKLITDDRVDLLLGPWGTPTHFAIAPVLERLKFPMVGSTAASVQLRELKPGNIWFVTPSMPDRIAQAIADQMKAAGYKTAAVIGNQLPFALEVKKFLQPALEKAGIKVVAGSDYPPDIKDMTALLTSVKQANPDGVIALSYPSDSILYMKQARELGVNAKFQFVMVGPSIDFFRKMFGAVADGIVSMGDWDPYLKNAPLAKPFYDAYVKKFNEEPDYLDSVESYVSCQILEQAVAKAGLDKDKLRETISTATFDTIRGPVKFDGVQNAITPAGLLQIQGKEMHVIWPQSRATAAFKPKGPWPAN